MRVVLYLAICCVAMSCSRNQDEFQFAPVELGPPDEDLVREVEKELELYDRANVTNGQQGRKGQAEGVEAEE